MHRWGCRNKKKWSGPLQYEDKTSQSLMMLPTDMALVWDKKFKPFVETYAKDEEKFFQVCCAPHYILGFRIEYGDTFTLVRNPTRDPTRWSISEEEDIATDDSMGYVVLCICCLRYCVPAHGDDCVRAYQAKRKHIPAIYEMPPVLRRTSPRRFPRYWSWAFPSPRAHPRLLKRSHLSSCHCAEQTSKWSMSHFRLGALAGR